MILKKKKKTLVLVNNNNNTIWRALFQNAINPFEVFMKMTFFYLDPYILLIFNLSC